MSDNRKAQWKRFTVNCAMCGKTVVKSNPQETCGLKCRWDLAKKRELESSPVGMCPFCGELKPLARVVKGSRVCSRRCAVSIWRRTTDERRRGSKSRARLLGPINSSMPCKYCGVTFRQKKANHVFCSTRCGDRWANEHGVKGKNLRAKKARRAEDRDRSIGLCSLCGVLWYDIRTMRDLGGVRKNAGARFHMDHITPKCRGGTETRPLCWFCNLAKLDMNPMVDAAIAAAGRAFWAQVKLLPPASTGGSTLCDPASSSPSFSCSPAEGLT